MDPLLARLIAPTGVPRRRGIVVVGVVIALAVLLVAVFVASSASAGSTAQVPAVRIRQEPTPSPSTLLVHVAGAVRRPGLVSLPEGARVVDAVAAAGGPTERADAAAVNLAAPVVDGQQVLVPQRGAPGAAPGAAGGAAPGTRISLGSATPEQLETLPGIGPALAARIVAWRDANGGFRSVDDLLQVGGIGPKTLAGLQDLVTP